MARTTKTTDTFSRVRSVHSARALLLSTTLLAAATCGADEPVISPPTWITPADAESQLLLGAPLATVAEANAALRTVSRLPTGMSDVLFNAGLADTRRQSETHPLVAPRVAEAMQTLRGRRS